MTMCDMYKTQITLLLACRIAVRLSSVIAGSFSVDAVAGERGVLTLVTGST